MTLARLLARAGDLKRAGLDCATCTPDLKRGRGCGRAPDLTLTTPDGSPREVVFADGSVEYWSTWDPDALVRWCAASDPPQTADAETAGAWYPHADLGSADYYTGSMWRYCPAYDAHQLEPGEVTVIADAAIRAASHVRLGLGLGAMLGDARPSNRS